MTIVIRRISCVYCVLMYLPHILVTPRRSTCGNIALNKHFFKEMAGEKDKKDNTGTYKKI